MKKVYISGPMRGIDSYNFPAFVDAEINLLYHGFNPINPAKNFNGDTTLPWETYMQTDIAQVLSADAIALLPGWQNSTGALVELAVALATGKDVMGAVTLEPIEGLHLVGGCGNLRVLLASSADVPTSTEKPGGGADYIDIHCPGGVTFRSQHPYTPQEAHDLGYEYGCFDGVSDADDDEAECCGMADGIGHSCDDCPYVVPECCGDPGGLFCNAVCAFRDDETDDELGEPECPVYSINLSQSLIESGATVVVSINP